MNKKLIIVGTGPFAQIARDYFDELSEYTVTAFACHEEFKESDTLNGIDLISIENLKADYSRDEYTVFVAVGYSKMNKIRQSIYEELKGAGFVFATFVYPNVKIWSSTSLGENVFIFEDNTIQPFTKIGDNTMLWSGNHIGHHSQIGDHCFISSHVVISGSCKLGNNIFIGVNSTFHDSLIIGDECLFGAGAIISRDTQTKEVYAPKSTKVHPKNSEEIGF